MPSEIPTNDAPSGEEFVLPEVVYPSSCDEAQVKPLQQKQSADVQMSKVNRKPNHQRKRSGAAKPTGKRLLREAFLLAEGVDLNPKRRNKQQRDSLADANNSNPPSDEDEGIIYAKDSPRADKDGQDAGISTIPLLQDPPSDKGNNAPSTKEQSIVDMVFTGDMPINIVNPPAPIQPPAADKAATIKEVTAPPPYLVCETTSEIVKLDKDGNVVERQTTRTLTYAAPPDPKTGDTMMSLDQGKTDSPEEKEKSTPSVATKPIAQEAKNRKTPVRMNIGGVVRPYTIRIIPPADPASKPSSDGDVAAADTSTKSSAIEHDAAEMLLALGGGNA